MSKIDQIETELKSIDQGKFQKLCDDYLHQLGHVIKSFGSVAGKNKTKKGTPDSYIILPNGKYIFVEYTTKDSGLLKKFSDDIDSCFDEKKTKIPTSEIEKVILCYNSKLSPHETRTLKQKCKDNQSDCEFIDIDTLKFAIKDYPLLGLDYLNIPPDTGQILKVQDFLKEYSRGSFATPLDNKFYFRSNDLVKCSEVLNTRGLLVISGKPGVGKSKFGIEGCKKYVEDNPEYEFYCIHNKNNKDLYYEINSYFKINRKYIILVDDANRLTQFEHILRLLSKEIFNVKLVITVRDYALDKILDICKDYSKESIELSPFSDQEIREILTEFNFNDKCLSIIERIAEGNPRLAMMAAKVAKESNNINELYNVCNIYDEYFSDISKKINDPYLLKTLGIISFFRFVNKEQKELCEKIYSEFNIPENIFWEKVLELHELEVVDLEQQDKGIVKISDQVLGTYFFYKVFIKEKILSYSTLLNAFFKDYQGKIKENTYPVFQTFNFKDVLEKISDALNSKLDSVKENEDELVDFLEIFWFCKKPTTIDYISKHVEGLPSVENPDFDFAPNKDAYSTVKFPYLDLLKLFCHHEDEYFTYSLEVLFKYVNKKPEILPYVTKYFEEDLAFEYDSPPDYYIQQELFNFLFRKLETEDNKLATGIIYQICNKFLHTHYNTVSSGRKHQVTIRSFSLLSDSTLIEFRKRLWDFLLCQYPNDPDRIYQLIKNYIFNSEIHPSTDILDHDSVYLLSFFNKYLSNSKYKHCKLVNTYIDRFSRKKALSTEFKELEKKFTNDNYKLYVLLQWNYERINKRWIVKHEEYDSLKKEQLFKYFKKYTLSDYESLFDSFIEILDGDKTDHHYFQTSFETVFTLLLERDKGLFLKSLESLFKKGNPLEFIPYKPFFVQSSQLLEEDRITLYQLIKNNSFPQKISWQCQFLESLRPGEINEFFLGELYNLYAGLVGGFNFYCGVADNYSHVCPDILNKLLTILIEKTEKEEFKFGIIDSKCFEKLLIENENNLNLAKKIYLYLKVNDAHHHFDYDGEGLKAILKRDSNFIKDYLNQKTDGMTYASRSTEYRCFRFIWDLDNYEEIINNIIDFCLIESEVYISDEFLNSFFKNIVDEGSKVKVENFISSFIFQKSSNKKAMTSIFGVITNSLPDKRVSYAKQFLSLNKDLEIFKSIPLTKNSWSGKSLIGLYETKITFWQNLNQEVQGFDYLKHKVWMDEVVDNCKKRIRAEVKREFVNEY